MPSALKLNQSISVLNRYLNDEHKIILKFYPTGKSPVSDYVYLKNFANQASLPLAQEGHYAVHDISWDVVGQHKRDVLDYRQMTELAIDDLINKYIWEILDYRATC